VNDHIWDRFRTGNAIGGHYAYPADNNGKGDIEKGADSSSYVVEETTGVSVETPETLM
jgi:hypothetical protein